GRSRPRAVDAGRDRRRRAGRARRLAAQPPGRPGLPGARARPGVRHGGRGRRRRRGRRARGPDLPLLRRRLPEPFRGRAGAVRGGRGMRLENSFDVAAPPETAWALLMDVPRVIPCMPGAELVETLGEDAWKARMRVKLGPISLAFLTDVKR